MAVIRDPAELKKYQFVVADKNFSYFGEIRNGKFIPYNKTFNSYEELEKEKGINIALIDIDGCVIYRSLYAAIGLESEENYVYLDLIVE